MELKSKTKNKIKYNKTHLLNNFDSINKFPIACEACF